MQAAGAIVADGEIAAALDAGSERVVLGSGALHDLAEAGRLIERYGERLVVGIEVEGDRIRARGRRSTDLPLRETLEAVHASGAARCLITGVARVSSLTGPDVHALALAVRLELPAIVAGGVASIDDLVALRDVGRGGRGGGPRRARGQPRPGGGDRVVRLASRRVPGH